MRRVENYKTGAKRLISSSACGRSLNSIASFPFAGYITRAVIYSFAMLVPLMHGGCSSNENAHTTATTFVPPPPRQVLTVVRVGLYTRLPPSPCETESQTKPAECVGVDPKKPLLVADLPNGKLFSIGQVVGINFGVHNAKLRSNGGDFRIRYIIDDEDPKWIDRDGPLGLSGWVPGNHTIRLELIGPDGWPYRNGNQNIVSCEITVEPK